MMVSGAKYQVRGTDKGQLYVIDYAETLEAAEAVARRERERGYYQDVEVFDYHAWAEEEEARTTENSVLGGGSL